MEAQDAEEKQAVDALREKAKQEHDDWHARYAEQLTKTKAANREGEAAFIAERDDSSAGAPFERISKLVDFNPKAAKSQRDTSRMRNVLLNVKQSPPVAT